MRALLTGLLFALPVTAQEHGPARVALEQFTEGLQGLRADFHQVVISNQGQLLEEGSGQVWMLSPDRFKWQYEGEFPELIVADGTRVWMHDLTLEQVTVREQSGLSEDSPLMLLTDLSGLDEQFTVTELGKNEGLDLLELTVTNRQAEFERILLGMRVDELAMMVMEDAFGMRTEIHFNTVERNPEMPQGLFDFVPPAGVDVIGEPEPGGQ